MSPKRAPDPGNGDEYTVKLLKRNFIGSRHLTLRIKQYTLKCHNKIKILNFLQRIVQTYYKWESIFPTLAKQVTAKIYARHLAAHIY